VTGESPVVDVKSSAAQKNLPTEILETTPFTNRFGPGAMLLAPGVNPNNYTSYGSGGSSSNSYMIDGVDVSDPEGGTIWVFANYNWIQEVQVIGLGAAAEYGGVADTVTVCFSKGLGCPLGAVLAGSRETMGKAWRGKFLFGGAMRQAGMIAAAALFALDHHVDLLADDHARARRLAEGLAEAGLPVDPEAVETNFVGLEVEPLGMTTEEATERIAAEGVLVGWLRPGVLRLATYLGITDGDIDDALAAIPRALAVRVP